MAEMILEGEQMIAEIKKKWEQVNLRQAS
jgi:hypothetical protein